MKFFDASPPIKPTLEQQRDALQKGLGRAMRWARSGALSEVPLLEACLVDQRWDRQVEDSRGAWLWRLVHIMDVKDGFRGPILHALTELTDEYSAYQFCELGCMYAKQGDNTFRSRLYDVVESRPIVEDPNLGELELLQLDGDDALAHLTRLRGRELADRYWEWHDGYFLDIATEVLGDNVVHAWLESSDDRAIRRFRDCWIQATTPSGTWTSPDHYDWLRSFSVSDVLAEAAKDSPTGGLFRGWGMQAESADLQIVFDALLEATKPSQVESLLRVFGNRAPPYLDAHLITLCAHPDDMVQRCAFSALENVAHADVRTFALERLEAGDWRGIGLLRANYESGDERTIMASVELPEGLRELHELCFDAIDFVKAIADCDCLPLSIIVYASTPCSNCRYFAARLLDKRQVAPEWLVQECRQDACEDCRTLFADNGSIAE